MVTRSDAVSIRMPAVERVVPGNHATVRTSPYFYAPLLEGLGVLSPPILISILVLLLYPDKTFWKFCLQASCRYGCGGLPLSVLMWLMYGSTLFRTYLDPVARSAFNILLAVTPICCWVLGVLLYYLGAGVFWTVFAYLAVFHFIRQQYGVYSLYARTVSYRSVWSRRVDIAAVYLSALYPLLYWHAHLPRSLSLVYRGRFCFSYSSGFFLKSLVQCLQ